MEPTVAPDPAGLVSVEPMVRLASAAVDGVVHPSPVSEAVPNHQGGDDAACDEQPSQPTWYRPRYVHGSPRAGEITNSGSSGPNANSPSGPANDRDANPSRNLGAPAR